MGVLSRLLRRAAPPPALETRFTGPLGGGWGMAALGSGRGTVPAHLAESLAAVAGCVELIAGALSCLPATLTMDDGQGGQVAAPPTATGWALLARPNVRQSWPACISSLVSSILLHGNGVAALVRDGRGAVIAVQPIPWQWLLPVIIQGAAGPRLAYDVVATTPESLLLGLPRRMLDTDVIHLRARSDEGVIGRSVLSRAAGVVREGVEVARTSEALFRNNLGVSGFVETGGAVLTEPQRDRFKASLGEFRGPGNAGKVMLLEGPFSFKPASSTPHDAELLATRQFSVAEVCRLFNVPEPLMQLGVRVPASLDPYLAAFAQLALAPLVAVLESEFDHAILPPGLHLQLDMAGLQRGNFAGQVAAFCAATQSGITTPNDARRGLGWPAHGAGDALRPGNAPSWPADAAGMPHLGPSAGHTGDGLPAPGTNEGQGAG